MSTPPYRQARKQIRRRQIRRILFRGHIALYTVSLILWFFWLQAQPIRYPVYLLFPTLWAFILVAHWVYNSSANAENEAVERLWENVYGARPGEIAPKPDPYDDTPPLERIRRAVENEITRTKIKRRQQLFRVNVVAYLSALLLGWIVIPVIYGPFLTESSAWTIFALSIAGLVELILHYLTIRLDTGSGERALRERLLGRAIQEAMLDGDLPEKAKRHSRLSDDGEVVDVNDWDDDESLKNQMSGV
jgi:hypothetical protein